MAPRFTKRARGVVAWETTGTAGPLTLATRAQMEFDGNIEFAVALTASHPVQIDDVAFDRFTMKRVRKVLERGRRDRDRAG